MILHRKDAEKISEILSKFPNVQGFELEQTNHSGIGSITTMSFAQEINGVKGCFEVEVSGVSDW